MTVSFQRFSYLPDPDSLLARLHLERETEEAEDFLALLAALAPHIAPCAAFMAAKISLDVPNPEVLIGGELFRGRLLRARLREVGTGGEVWPYVATCGKEGYERLSAITDPLERFWGEYVLEDALDTARRGLDEFFHHAVHDGPAASIAPGSLPEWPIEEQRPLFRLLGEAAALCGVRLTDSMLMLPGKSVSGIRFPGGGGYVSCVYCARENCVRRKAPHDPAASWET